MKKAIAVGAVFLALASLDARATELGLLVDKSVGRSQTLGAAGSGLPAGSYDRAAPTGWGVRAAYTLLDLDVAELGAAVTYHPKAQDDLIQSGINQGKLGNQYFAVGVQADWKFLVNLHAGLDLRSEKITSSAANGVSDSTTLWRPWVKAGVGWAAPTPVVSPFVRLEVAVPLTSSDSSNSTDDFRKAMAPSLQVALYGGIRF
jgi:hypothetical protein